MVWILFLGGPIGGFCFFHLPQGLQHDTQIVMYFSQVWIQAYGFFSASLVSLLQATMQKKLEKWG